VINRSTSLASIGAGLECDRGGCEMGCGVASGAFGMLQDPVLVAIAERHGKTPGQVVLRWHVQSGRTALPKTSKAQRMVENRDIYDFALSDDEMQSIDALGGAETRRTCPDPSTVA
jgi:diketogulonate reductase-like aldo/keto reductase